MPNAIAQRGPSGRGARERVLQAATQLFYDQGINATGVDQIAAVAQVSKRSLYKHFAGKDELIDAYVARLADSEPDRDLPPRERILGYFADRPRPDGQPLRGCPFLNTAVEVVDPDHPAHRRVIVHKTDFARELAALAAQAGASEPDALGEQLAVIFDGTAARAMALNSLEPFGHARSAVETLLDAHGVDHLVH
jgi:AcrR family transcriptional regulator